MKRPSITISTRPLEGREHAYEDTVYAVTCRPDGTMVVGTYTTGTVKEGYDGFVSGGREIRKGKPETDRQVIKREWKQETKTKASLTLLTPVQPMLYTHRLPHKKEPEKLNRHIFTLVGRPLEARLPRDTREMEDFRLPSVDDMLKLIRTAEQYGFPQLPPSKSKRKPLNRYNFMRTTMLALHQFASDELLPGQRNFGGWQGVEWEELEARKR